VSSTASLFFLFIFYSSNLFLTFLLLLLLLYDDTTDLALAVGSQDDDIKRLSLNSIEAFHHTESGLEHLVATVKHQQERKSNLYSLCASAAVVMGVCYVVASLFTSDDADAAMPSADAAGSPTFLMPSYLP
jgi:heme/copper-type cytochrome/quinol oxidase subunit 3